MLCIKVSLRRQKVNRWIYKKSIQIWMSDLWIVSQCLFLCLVFILVRIQRKTCRDQKISNMWNNAYRAFLKLDMTRRKMLYKSNAQKCVLSGQTYRNGSAFLLIFLNFIKNMLHKFWRIQTGKTHLSHMFCNKRIRPDRIQEKLYHLNGLHLSSIHFDYYLHYK